MEIKISLKVGLKDCGFGRILGLCGSGYEGCLNYLCWTGLFKGKLVYFCILIAIMILSWVCI